MSLNSWGKTGCSSYLRSPSVRAEGVSGALCAKFLGGLRVWKCDGVKRFLGCQGVPAMLQETPEQL